MINSKKNNSYYIAILEIISHCTKKVSSGLFKNLINKMCLQIIFDIHV